MKMWEKEMVDDVRIILRIIQNLRLNVKTTHESNKL